MTLEILRPGSKVRIGDQRQGEGTIIEVKIDADLSVIYEVSYWVGLEYRIIWLNELEFQTTAETRKIKVGFQ
jgi:hypothetical protein